MKVVLAFIKCWWYCLTHMSKGYCIHTEKKGKLFHTKYIKIATVTGSIFNNTLKVKRVFYESPND